MTERRIDFNIIIIGPQCTGKTSVLNNIIGRQISEICNVRNTFVPFVFEEKENLEIDKNRLMKISDEIKNYNLNNKIKYDNDKHLQSKESLRNNMKTFDIPIIKDLYVNDKVRKYIKFNICDFPGLTDQTSKSNLYQLLRDSLHDYDMIIYVESAQDILNRSISDTEFMIKELMEIINNIDKNNILFLPILNKIDTITNEINRETLHERLKLINFENKNLINLNDKKFIDFNAKDALIHRCIPNDKCLEILDPETAENVAANFHGTYNWHKADTIKKKQIIFDKIIPDSILNNIGELEQSSKFSDFKSVFNTLINSNYKKIFTVKERIHFNEIIKKYEKYDDNNFDQMCEDIELLIIRSRKLNTDIALHYHKDLINDIRPLIEDFHNESIKQIDELLTEQNIQKYGYAKLKDDISKIRSKYTQLNKSSHNEFEVEINKGIEVCNVKLHDLYGILLFTISFDTSNTHKLDSIKIIMNELIEVKAFDLIIKFFKEVLMNELYFDKLFFNKNIYVIELLSLFKHKYNDILTELWIEILNFRLDKINENDKSIKDKDYFKTYLKYLRLFLEYNEQKFRENNILYIHKILDEKLDIQYHRFIKDNYVIRNPNPITEIEQKLLDLILDNYYTFPCIEFLLSINVCFDELEYKNDLSENHDFKNKHDENNNIRNYNMEKDVNSQDYNINFGYNNYNNNPNEIINSNTGDNNYGMDNFDNEKRILIDVPKKVKQTGKKNPTRRNNNNAHY